MAAEWSVMVKDPTYAAWLAGFSGGGEVTLSDDGMAPEIVLNEFRRLDFSGCGKITAGFSIDPSLKKEGYRVIGGENSLKISGADGAGLLYGVYAVNRLIGSGKKLSEINEESAPVVSRRALNHWDNIDGSVERGYAGNSLFFKNNRLSYDAERIEDYARLLASVGINQVCLNNVNVTEESALLITEKHLPDLSGIAGIFREFNIRLIISVEFGAPKDVGGLDSADPLDASVELWWKNQAETVYRHIPDLAGFLVKADSEFRTGPAALGRTQADGANVIAKALEPFGGVVYWRCFVYNCMQDWRDVKTDRPKAAYDHFHPLDGKFLGNVILQIKNGPTDFQVREPNSPLIGSMKKTRQCAEFQITGEYTGQQIDLYGLAVQWEEFFSSRISEHKIMSDLFPGSVDSICAVANVGLDECWTGNPLAQANLYSFGRLAWNNRLTAAEITNEWAALTFGGDEDIIRTVTDMILRSREVYEKYNAPLGIGWMVNINHHYGPSPDGYEYMKWGTYHRANHTEIGVDRTKSGTGFTRQYDPFLADVYDDIKTCPEDLLLFFHRAPFDYMLKSGKTIIQHIYDAHFEGVEDVKDFISAFDGLKPLLPEIYWKKVSERFEMQLKNAEEWRDVINTYFFRLTAVGDLRGRKIYD